MTIDPAGRQIDWGLRWEAANIPAGLRGQTLADWAPQTPAGHKALRVATEFVATLPERLLVPDEDADRMRRAYVGEGMSIIGNNGTGKTELAAAILTTAHQSHSVSIFYIRADQFVTACVRYANPPKDEALRWDPSGQYQAAARMRSRAAKRSLVVFDDLGKEHKTDSQFAQRTINNYLRYRFEMAKPTIVNSNVPVEKWGIYDAALPSFARQALPTIALIGGDLRGRR